MRLEWCVGRIRTSDRSVRSQYSIQLNTDAGNSFDTVWYVVTTPCKIWCIREVRTSDPLEFIEYSINWATDANGGEGGIRTGCAFVSILHLAGRLQRSRPPHHTLLSELCLTLCWAHQRTWHFILLSRLLSQSNFPNSCAFAQFAPTWSDFGLRAFYQQATATSAAIKQKELTGKIITKKREEEQKEVGKTCSGVSSGDETLLQNQWSRLLRLLCLNAR